ncbi:hypothetical protein BSR42_13125, partial [Megasphaera cerevisiae]
MPGMPACPGLSLTAPVMAAESPVGGGGGKNSVTTRVGVGEADRAKEEAKLEPQQTPTVTGGEIAKKQDKSEEDVIFSETGAV